MQIELDGSDFPRKFDALPLQINLLLLNAAMRDNHHDIQNTITCTILFFVPYKQHVSNVIIVGFSKSF